MTLPKLHAMSANSYGVTGLVSGIVVAAQVLSHTVSLFTPCTDHKDLEKYGEACGVDQETRVPDIPCGII